MITEGKEPQIRSGEAQTEQAEVTDYTGHQRIQAIFTLPQQPDHHRHINQLDQNGDPG